MTFRHQRRIEVAVSPRSISCKLFLAQNFKHLLQVKKIFVSQ
jgi:hypothetical protein